MRLNVAKNEAREQIQQRRNTTEIKELLNSFADDEYARHKLTFDVENLDSLTKKFFDELNDFVDTRVNKRLIPADKEVDVFFDGA